MKVDRFAFTANNITDAMLGDQLKYWQLFPAPNGFGNIPVWGFGDVIASNHPGVLAGERLFGCFPIATHLLTEASGVGKRPLRDAAAHRQGVAPVYSAYARLSGDPAYARLSGDPAYAGRQGDDQALLRPLFMLSFLIDDFLSGRFFRRRQRDPLLRLQQDRVRAPHLGHSRRPSIRVIGLTSAAHARFVASLGCYHEVLSYDPMTSLRPDTPVAFLDMAGNSDLRAKLHVISGSR